MSLWGRHSVAPSLSLSEIPAMHTTSAQPVARRLFTTKMPKTYATPENVDKAVAKCPHLAEFDYVVAVDATGRYFACFLGQRAIAALHAGFAVAN